MREKEDREINLKENGNFIEMVCNEEGGDPLLYMR